MGLRWALLWMVLAVLVVAGRGRGWENDVLIVVAWAGGIASDRLYLQRTGRQP